MAIDLRHDRGDRPASANRNAKIMDRLGIRRSPDAPKLLEHTIHP
jgi:hypothetical protein